MPTHHKEKNRIRVGLMGFGRIGRNLYRLASEVPEIEFPVVSDLGRPEILHYLLQRDSIHGSFHHEVEFFNDQLQLADERHTEMIQRIAPKDVDWSSYDVDLVIDATGKYRSKANLQDYLNAGAKRVIISTLPEDTIDRLVVVGVNENTISSEDRMISAGSSTTNAVALMLKILDEAFGIDRAMMTTVHAYTADQPLQDTAGQDFRRSRSAAENIIPNMTPTPAWIGAVLPSFAGRLDGIALNVPVPDGSCVDLTSQFKKTTVEVDAVNEAMRTAAARSPEIIAVIEDPIVSRDVIGNQHSLVFDCRATMKTPGRMVKTLAWYDNGWGHAARLLDLIKAYAQLDGKGGAA
jgi:glyceraldehyde-3-phosphate dehydrogenase type I